ncbi:MAG: hypothetical protein EKK69_10845 [Candidatus Competibacteraceae bacterium]|nr:MAG: hypothetical protein EKK69_10845 [Candidatus Competibacteraceae bacterium]
MRHALLALLRAVVLLPSMLMVLIIRAAQWLVAPLALLLQLLIAVPLALHRVRQPLRPRFIPIDEVEWPDAAWIEMRNTSDALNADGFVVAGDFRNTDLIQGAVLWLRLFGQPGHGVVALAAHLEFTHGIRPLRRFITFASGFTDGRVLETNNLDLPYSLPTPAYLARVQLKDVWDARALYSLHSGLITSLGKNPGTDWLTGVRHDPLSLLSHSYQREIEALARTGWLHLDPAGGPCRLTLRAALRGVWRQAWPLSSLYLNAAHRQASALLAGHGLDVAACTGSASSILVEQQLLPAATTVSTVKNGHDLLQSLLQRIDAEALLDSVVAELESDTDGMPCVHEFRYTFQGYADQPSRRIRRLWSFELLLDVRAGRIACTACDRDHEQAADSAEWIALSAEPPLQPLILGSDVRDLDQILPMAWALLREQAPGKPLSADSASLYLGENGQPRWQIVAWGSDDQPLQILLDARSGVRLND